MGKRFTLLCLPRCDLSGERREFCEQSVEKMIELWNLGNLQRTLKRSIGERVRSLQYTG